MPDSKQLREEYEAAEKAARQAEKASDKASEASIAAHDAWKDSLTDEEHEAVLRTQMNCQYVSSDHVKAVLRLLDKVRVP